MDARRTVQFTITAYVDPDHEAYDDPEWLADAAAGALQNLYGVECIYGEVQRVSAEE